MASTSVNLKYRFFHLGNDAYVYAELFMFKIFVKTLVIGIIVVVGFFFFLFFLLFVCFFFLNNNN